MLIKAEKLKVRLDLVMYFDLNYENETPMLNSFNSNS